MSTMPTINLDLSQELAIFFRLLNRRKLSVFVVALLVFTGVGIMTAMQKPVYRASAAITIDMETPSLLAIYSSRDDAAMAQTNYLTYADYYRTQLEIMKSRRIAELVFESLQLADKPRYKHAPDPVRQLMKQIDVEPVKQTRLVMLRVTDTNPQKAAEIANEAARIFVEENLLRTTRSEALNLMKNEYMSLQSKEAELSKRYKPKFPARARIRNQMEQLAKAIEQQQNARDGRVASADSAVDSLKDISAAGKPQAAENLRPNNIWIQTPAHPPVQPYKPNKPLNLLLGLLFGIVCGIAVAALEEFFDATIKNSNDVTDIFPISFLGHVPLIPEDPASPTAPPQRYQLMMNDPDSEIAEAYRVIRTNLLCLPRKTNESAILITSPGSEEGKTTTSCNVAAALAQTGVSVVLIDADLRKPNIHRALELPQTPGLTEYLTGKKNLQDCILSTKIPGLFVIPSGALPRNPSELLGSPKMKEFYQHILPKFNFVLIDTAPIIPVTDATILASLTRTVLTVAQAGKTPREAYKKTVEICNRLNADILGLVLNKVPRADITGYGYGYQIYKYGKPSQKPQVGKFTLTHLLENLLQKVRRWYAQKDTGKRSS